MADSLFDRMMIGLIQIVLMVILWIVIVVVGFNAFMNGIVKLVQAIQSIF
jgi:hypothetical protein